jgi:hypothetical protein
VAPDAKEVAGAIALLEGTGALRSAALRARDNASCKEIAKGRSPFGARQRQEAMAFSQREGERVRESPGAGM